jgi:PAS domain S-box-containing protein
LPDAHSPRLNALLDGIDAGFWYCDLPSGSLHFDAKAEHHFGLAAQTVPTLDSFCARLHPEDLSRFRRAMEAAVADKAQCDTEFRVMPNPARPHWVRLIARACYSDSGEPVRLDGMTLDIARRKQIEERFHTALDASGTGTFHWNIRGGSIEWDESLRKLFCLAVGRTTGDLDTFLSTVHPDNRTAVAERFQKAAVEGADFQMEFRILWPDGVTRWIFGRGRTFTGDGGVPAYMAGACVDITTRRATEELLEERARISELTAAIGVALTQGTSISETLRMFTEAIVHHLDAAFARIWTLSDDSTTLELQASAGFYTHLNGPHSRVPVGKFKIGLIAEERRPHLTNDVLNDPRVGDPEWARREGMISFAGYPLVVEGRLIGVVALFARRHMGSETMISLGAIANNIAVGIERKRNEAALRISEARKTAILETSLDCIITIDSQSRILEFNPAAETTFGFSREEALGRYMPDLIIPPDLRARHAQGIARY